MIDVGVGNVPSHGVIGFLTTHAFHNDYQAGDERDHENDDANDSSAADALIALCHENAVPVFFAFRDRYFFVTDVVFGDNTVGVFALSGGWRALHAVSSSFAFRHNTKAGSAVLVAGADGLKAGSIGVTVESLVLAALVASARFAGVGSGVAERRVAVGSRVAR